MAEITKEQFKVVGKNTKTMESISRPNIGYRMHGDESARIRLHSSHCA